MAAVQIVGTLDAHIVHGDQGGRRGPPRWSKRLCVLSVATQRFYLLNSPEHRHAVPEPEAMVSVIDMDLSRRSTPRLSRRQIATQPDPPDPHLDPETETVWPSLHQQLHHIGVLEGQKTRDDAAAFHSLGTNHGQLPEYDPCVIDLADHPIAVQLVHPSVFGSEGYFQIRIPGLTCFFGAVHRQARNFWVSGLHACRENRGEAYATRDCRITIERARDLPPRGCFRCELFIDGVCCGQTATAVGEHGNASWQAAFVFRDLPTSAQTIDVKLYENRKGQDRPLGSVSISLNGKDSTPEDAPNWHHMVNSRKGIHGFLRRISHSDSTPARLAVGVQTTDVFVVKAEVYYPLLVTLKPYVARLCDELRTCPNQQWHRPLVSVLRVIGGMEGVLITLVEHETKKELSAVLRDSGTASKLFAAYMCLSAREFLIHALRQTIEQAYLTTINFNLSHGSPREKEHTQQSILCLAETLWRNILAALVHLPADVRELLSRVEVEFSRSGLRPELSRRIVARLVFLYFLLPAIVSPSKAEYMLHMSKPKPQARKVLIALSKIIEKLASGKLFEPDDPLEFANEFLEEHSDSVEGFMSSVATPPKTSVTKIPLVPSTRQLALLLAALSDLHELSDLAEKHGFVAEILEAVRSCAESVAEQRLSHDITAGRLNDGVGRSRHDKAAAETLGHVEPRPNVGSNSAVAVAAAEGSNSSLTLSGFLVGDGTAADGLRNDRLAGSDVPQQAETERMGRGDSAPWAPGTYTGFLPASPTAAAGAESPFVTGSGHVSMV
eukprot:m.74529 g.74529  ORF g.74529 m.74529 type:complete len:780 (-) comp14439_c0_seq3:233-2572(-)